MILHVDMDAFYASVEQRDQPHLRGLPIVVGGSADGRGVVAAASYEARVFGIHSAMSAKRAKQLCPNAIFVRPRIDHYAKVSREIRSILERFTPIIEPLSLDEAFLDVTGTLQLLGSALHIGQSIQSQILSETGLVASIGIAPNKFLAKIASDLKKPNALVMVPPDAVQDFLDPLPVSRLWGVGKVGLETFKKYSISTIAQLRSLPIETLDLIFGNAGLHYWNLAHGIDDRKVIPDREAKSISNETTFETDITDRDQLKAWLVILIEQVARRMRNHNRKGRTSELKLRYSNFHSITRSRTLASATNITQELLQQGMELFETRIPRDTNPVRLIGFGVSSFETSDLQQLSLFDEQERDKQRSLDGVTDLIALKFGKNAIHRAAGHEKRQERNQKNAQRDDPKSNSESDRPQ